MTTTQPDRGPGSHIMREAALEWAEFRHGTAIAVHSAAIANRIGAKKLGFRLVELAPGNAAFPKHFHYANEEMFYVLHGEGALRLGETEFCISRGDCISMPAGDPLLAHQLVNTSASALRYLAVSTMHEPDVVIYPDSGKIAIYAGAAPGGRKEERTFEHVALQNQAADYWLNED